MYKKLFNTWKKRILQYAETYFQLFKLGLIEKVSTILGSFIFVMISMFLTCLVLIFVGFGIAEFFSSWFDSRAAGYFAASGVFVVFIVVVALCRRAIMSALAGVFVKMMTDDEDGDDAEDKDGNEITN